MPPPPTRISSNRIAPIRYPPIDDDEETVKTVEAGDDDSVVPPSEIRNLDADHDRRFCERYPWVLFILFIIAVVAIAHLGIGHDEKVDPIQQQQGNSSNITALASGNNKVKVLYGATPNGCFPNADSGIVYTCDGHTRHDENLIFLGPCTCNITTVSNKISAVFLCDSDADSIEHVCPLNECLDMGEDGQPNFSIRLEYPIV